MFRKIQKLLRNTKGVATSLLEATATIAVGATLAGAAITVVTDKVQQARIAATAQDVQMIGDAINNFEKDNGFYPIFTTAGEGNKDASGAFDNNKLTGPVGSGTGATPLNDRTNVDLLESEKGDEPEQGSTDLNASINNVAEVFKTANHLQTQGGHGSATETAKGWRSGLKDTIENQLSKNGPGYVVRGAFAFDTKRGFNGPYMAKVPPTDAWGNKFKVNALYLDDHRVSTNDTNPFMTFVLSAGPNEKIQTLFEVTAQNVGGAIGGDDILFRVR